MPHKINERVEREMSAKPKFVSHSEQRRKAGISDIETIVEFHRITTDAEAAL